MIPAIDAYSYHRSFGQHYPGLETPSDTRLTTLEFLDRAAAMGAGGVSLESCFFDSFDDRVMSETSDRLDSLGLRRVWAWGHPDGLHSGRCAAALEDLERHIILARRLGAGTMRICAGGRNTRPDSWADHRAALLPMLRRAADRAAAADVALALENHLDLYADELVELIETVGSPHLGVCLDTGNNLRLFEDPVEVAAKLAPWTRATHLKDLHALGGDPRQFGFWPSVPIGSGLVDIPAILRLLAAQDYTGLLAIELDYLHPDVPSVDVALQQSLRALDPMLRAL